MSQLIQCYSFIESILHITTQPREHVVDAFSHKPVGTSLKLALEIFAACTRREVRLLRLSERKGQAVSSECVARNCIYPS